MAVGDFADRICASKMLRAARGEVPLEEFAARLGVPASRLERWEMGAHFSGAMLTRALRVSGVPRYLLDTRQLKAVGEFTEATKRFLNDPEAQRKRTRALISGKARLVGYAVAASAIMLFGAGILSDGLPTGLALPGHAAATPVPQHTQMDENTGVLVAAPSPSSTPMPTPTPDPVVEATPEAPDTPTPVVVPEPTAAPQQQVPVPTPVPTVPPPTPIPDSGLVGKAVQGVTGSRSGDDGGGDGLVGGTVGAVGGVVGGLLGSPSSGDGS